MDTFFNDIVDLLDLVEKNNSSEIFFSDSLKDLKQSIEDFFEDVDDIQVKINKLDMLSVCSIGHFLIICRSDFINSEMLFDDFILALQGMCFQIGDLKLDSFGITNFSKIEYVCVQKVFIDYIETIKKIMFVNKKNFISDQEFDNYIAKCDELSKIADKIHQKIDTINVQKKQDVIDILQFISMKLALGSMLSAYMINLAENVLDEFDLDECD